MILPDNFKDILQNKTVLLTGGGGGIGFETAKHLAQMGARVIIAEIDPAAGERAEQSINELFPSSAEYYNIDLADETAIREMYRHIIAKHGKIDVLINNATYVSVESVERSSLKAWDLSYAVNLRAPLLLSQLCLPDMLKAGSGALIFVSSSGAAPYLGAYEVFKTAQVELANTLTCELEGSGVNAFTIGPGLVKTKTAEGSITIVAQKMGISVQEFYEMTDSALISAEQAGLGFALAAAHPQRYNGQETASVQVLSDFDLMETRQEASAAHFNKELLAKIRQTFSQQYEGWQSMVVFKRQWVLRDFKKCMGISADTANDKLRDMATGTIDPCAEKQFFDKLKLYWEHQLQLLSGYEKDPKALAENSAFLKEWICDIEKLFS